VVGCGDVAFRSYLGGLATLAGRARVVACFDVVGERAERAAGMFEGARAYTSFEELLAHPGLEAVVNLTPPPFHYEYNAAALRAGLHVFSEKPLAATLEQALELVELADDAGKLLLAAPALMAAPRFRWLRELVRSGQIGSPTLATSRQTSMGPAMWREYTGDVSAFYSPGVGPLVDIGVYALHAVTGLFGPACRVQAMGGISIPTRRVLAGPAAGGTLEVRTNDHMLVDLDFGENRFAQVLASYAVPRSQAPALEVHCTRGSISIDIVSWYDAQGGIDLYRLDDSPLGLDGWTRGLTPPEPSTLPNVLVEGPAHLVACLAGEEEPILTARHACHVLEIIHRAFESASQGRALDLETRF
jgi:predicted dehydrogenase